MENGKPEVATKGVVTTKDLAKMKKQTMLIASEENPGLDKMREDIAQAFEAVGERARHQAGRIADLEASIVEMNERFVDKVTGDEEEFVKFDERLTAVEDDELKEAAKEPEAPKDAKADKKKG